MSHKVNIVLGATGNMEITPAAGGSTELINKDNISAVIPVKFNKKPNNGIVVYENASGPFVIGETVTGGTSAATGVIQSFNGTTGLVLSDVVGVFVLGEQITGGTSTETADVAADYIPQSFDGEWSYEYDTMTVIQVQMNDGSRMAIELQNVANQATWNLGTLAALNAAITAINAWL
jgi:hypothetical protein